MEPDLKNPPEQQPEADYDKPVAYGINGEPLYAHPLQVVQPGPQFVHLSRAVDPVKPQVSVEVKQKHDESVAAYPYLNLSEQEYILAAVRRHPIGLIIPVAVTLLLVLVLAFMLGAYPAVTKNVTLPTGGSLPSVWVIALPAFLFMALIVLGGFVACWVYLKNKFFLTNESIIQDIQLSLFSRDEQTISLANIEDVSFKQEGIMQALLNYGTIRLSTEGDESTYRFDYVANPKHQTALLNNAVESFKNGRPVSSD